ncbi:hypothetical protein [Bradyrhizobium vignae]|uniref:hypothetical protein n=1 Tax=Bradyrhizobium vignae TaxID=1549949 RepID=UPI0013E8C39A|nr:hypothetical protein [Bradyrhizobium vignae]
MAANREVGRYGESLESLKEKGLSEVTDLHLVARFPSEDLLLSKDSFSGEKTRAALLPFCYGEVSRIALRPSTQLTC